jgi:membrane protein YdbS with pleckstrin-like domain
MVHVTPTSTSPLFVNKFVLPSEHQVVCVRLHPAKLLGPASLVLAGLIGAGLLSTVTGGIARGAIWLAWGVLLLWLIWKFLNWLVEYFVVTSKRVLLASGLLLRTVEMMPLVKVTDMSLQQSVRGRILKYGRFIFESAGQEQHLRKVDYIPHPEQHYLEVIGVIFADEDKVDNGGILRIVKCPASSSTVPAVRLVLKAKIENRHRGRLSAGAPRRLVSMKVLSNGRSARREFAIPRASLIEAGVKVDLISATASSDSHGTKAG